ncbi:FAD-dependent oxidoreductase [Arthrobacter rhombi]|uniref:NAD(P)/FAD-dependent oxidoreductase n=1 Tax=Arthrobacter rhombi TaxID=71253 RepID=UPI0031DBAD20
MTTRRVVVVGAGHAGGTFVAMLRQQGYDGGIDLVGSEPHLPYHRPPLSKSVDGDGKHDELRGADFYHDNAVSLHLSRTVREIDPVRQAVHLDTGDQLDYDVLVLATGAAPRMVDVPGATLEGVHTLRTVEDAAGLRASLGRGKPLAIVGGGYVGLEVAAAARARDVGVTVIEREERVLARVASPGFSDLIAATHRAAGTTILTGAELGSFSCDMGRVGAVVLADGTRIPCGAALVGVGAVPRDGLARHAGLTCEGGIVVDEDGRTSDPAIFALGDVTSRPVPGAPTANGRMRLESIPGAVDQAKRAAAAIVGQTPGGATIPWFWSDQFDLKIKIAGIVGGEYASVLRGDPESRSFALFHHRDGVLVAAETVNSPRDFMAAKALLASGDRVDPRVLADPSLDVRAQAVA